MQEYLKKLIVIKSHDEPSELREWKVYGSQNHMITKLIKCPGISLFWAGWLRSG